MKLFSSFIHFGVLRIELRNSHETSTRPKSCKQTVPFGLIMLESDNQIKVE
jgi:hypothetical protein